MGIETEQNIEKKIMETGYCDFHFHWEKDEWYPDGSFRNTGRAIRNPIELLFQDYAGNLFVRAESFPYKNKWEFLSVCVENEMAAYELAQPYFKKFSGEKSLETLVDGFKILYEMPELDMSDRKQYVELSLRVKAAYKDGILKHLPGAYRKAGIVRSINIWTSRYAREHFDNLTEENKQLELKFLPATFRFDYALVLPFRYRRDFAIAKWFLEFVQDINGLPVIPLRKPWEMSQIHIREINRYLKSISFDEYLVFLDKAFDYFASRGVSQMKSACCFARTVEFREREEKDARKAFNKLQSEFLDSQDMDFEETLRVFEDFIFFRCINMARDRKWQTIQIHTGHKGKDIETSRPALLEEVIAKNPDMNFILLHGGKHYYNEVLDLCARYKNAIADFTWIPLLEPELGRKMAKAFISEFPYRTVAGLDMANIEGSAGMAHSNKKLIAEILNELLKEKKISSMDEAYAIGKSVINAKPKELFPLSF
ncbi:MAG: Amidohydrolase 2 [Candidatus Uhrbacteria bacterium GW2011_GWF2_39_13]|uniref:Amidohydrolase 2 n=1 Tax=Candidatus Uhrbacteria bacterium GW2011_GWF2_39_13 TaxID=1618995 RepID=A0A0G0MMS6_9BACT|nr:MAG: Amidohydrolase 2 [Candidatus Uhrbacteria bacterium GW2011_GWF2_39_13]